MVFIFSRLFFYVFSKYYAVSDKSVSSFSTPYTFARLWLDFSLKYSASRLSFSICRLVQCLTQRMQKWASEEIHTQTDSLAGGMVYCLPDQIYDHILARSEQKSKMMVFIVHGRKKTSQLKNPGRVKSIRKRRREKKEGRKKGKRRVVAAAAASDNHLLKLSLWRRRTSFPLSRRIFFLKK